MRTLLSFEPFPSFSVAMVQLVDPVSWGKSIADQALLELLVGTGILPPITDPARPEWIAPGSTEVDPKPPTGYISAWHGCTSGASASPPAGSSAHSATTMGWSCTTSPLMPSRRR